MTDRGSNTKPPPASLPFSSPSHGHLRPQRPPPVSPPSSRPNSANLNTAPASKTKPQLPVSSPSSRPNSANLNTAPASKAKAALPKRTGALPQPPARSNSNSSTTAPKSPNLARKTTTTATSSSSTAQKTARPIPQPPGKKESAPAASSSSPQNTSTPTPPPASSTPKPSEGEGTRYSPLSTEGLVDTRKDEKPAVAFTEGQANQVTSAPRVSVMTSSLGHHAKNLTKHIAGRLGTVEQKWVPIEERLEKDPNTPLEHTKQLTQLVHKHGVPEYLRSRFWLNVTGTAARMSSGTGLYYLLVNKYKDKHKMMMEEAAADDAAGKNHSKAVAIIIQIDKDVYRTAVNGDRDQQSAGKEALRRILVTYSFFNANVGYCQAMHKIAALFLDRFTEEESFWMLSSTVDNILPRDYFSESMMGLHSDIDTFNTLAHSQLPRLMMTLRNSGVMVEMFLSQWFMSLFIGSMQPAAANRVLDIVFYDGSFMLFQVILGMLKNFEAELSKMQVGDQTEPLDPGMLMGRLQQMPQEVTESQFYNIVFSLDIPPKDQVDGLRKAFRSKRDILKEISALHP